MSAPAPSSQLTVPALPKLIRLLPVLSSVPVPVNVMPACVIMPLLIAYSSVAPLAIEAAVEEMVRLEKVRTPALTVVAPV